MMRLDYSKLICLENLRVIVAMRIDISNRLRTANYALILC